MQAGISQYFTLYDCWSGISWTFFIRWSNAVVSILFLSIKGECTRKFTSKNWRYNTLLRILIERHLWTGKMMTLVMNWPEVQPYLHILEICEIVRLTYHNFTSYKQYCVVFLIFWALSIIASTQSCKVYVDVKANLKMPRQVSSRVQSAAAWFLFGDNI